MQTQHRHHVRLIHALLSDLPTSPTCEEARYLTNVFKSLCRNWHASWENSASDQLPRSDLMHSSCHIGGPTARECKLQATTVQPRVSPAVGRDSHGAHTLLKSPATNSRMRRLFALQLRMQLLSLISTLLLNHLETLSDAQAASTWQAGAQTHCPSRENHCPATRTFPVYLPTCSAACKSAHAGAD